MLNFGRRVFENREGIARVVFALLQPFVFLGTIASTFIVPMVWGNGDARLLVAAVLALPMVFYFVALLIMRLDWMVLKGIIIFGGFIALYRWMASVNARNDPGNMINWHWATSIVLLVILFAMNRMADNLAPFLPTHIPSVRIHLDWDRLGLDITGRWNRLTATQHAIIVLCLVLTPFCGFIWPPLLAVYLFFRWSREPEKLQTEAQEAGKSQPAEEAVPTQSTEEVSHPKLPSTSTKDVVVPVSDAWKKHLKELEAGQNVDGQPANDYDYSI